MLGARGTSIMQPPPSSSQPVFTVKARDGKARLGILTTQGGTIRTPESLIYTRRGGNPNLVPDMLQRLSPAPTAFQLDILHFLTAPGPETMKLHGGGARGFLSMGKAALVLASNRDPTLYEYGGKPSGDKSIYCTIHAGARSVTPETYMDVVEALQPDLYVTMCDEVTATTRSKQTKASVNRTIKWLDSCLELQHSKGLGALPLAAISGGSSTHDRERSAAEAAAREVAGFALCGFGTGEEPGHQRQALLEAAVGKLPDGKARFISGVSTPSEVLDAVAQGIDLFDNSYVAAVTAGGYALAFPLRPAAATDEAGQGEASVTGAAASDGGDDKHGQQQQQQAAAAAAGTLTDGQEELLGSDESKLNLWSVGYRLDKGPLVAGCSCFTCSRHSRAYVHHLLQVHEMLAEVLLELHNTHHYLAFMQAAREAIEAGTFEEYRTWFKARLDPGSTRASLPQLIAAAPQPQPTMHMHTSEQAPAHDQGMKGSVSKPVAADGSESPASKKPRWQSA